MYRFKYQDQCRKVYNLVSLSSDLYRSLTYEEPVLFLLLLILHRPHNLPLRQPYLLILLHR